VGPPARRQGRAVTFNDKGFSKFLRELMDNLTHTLIGLIAGESVAHSTRTREPGLAPEVRRGLFVATAAIGGNLPDLDLIYSYRGVPHDTQAKLSYVLQHRGYTHTVLGCLVLAALLYAGAELWLRYRHLAVTRRDRLELAGMCIFGTFLHLGMDFLNSYGVHPFWPVENGWFYGDSVFIVEPLYWAAAAPLIFVTRSTVVRVVIALALLAVPVLSVVTNLIPTGSCVGFLLVTALLLVIGWRASARTAAVASAVTLLACTGTFIAGGQLAARSIDAGAAAEFRNDHIVDHVLSPGPLDPLCWNVLLLETNGDHYVVRRAVVSSTPVLLSANQCPPSVNQPRLNQPTAVPMTPVAAPESRAIHWLGEFSMSRTVLAQIVAGNCDAAAFMRFARAPFVAELERKWVIGDLRFPGGRGGGMANIDLHPDSPGPCPRTPPWTPPREALLH
jgi:inner membrane protein